MLRPPRRLAALVAAAAMALALAAGCGGDDEEAIPVITGPTGPTGFGDSQGSDEGGRGEGNR